MKRWLIWAAAAALLLSALFSCGKDMVPSPYAEEDFSSEGARLSIEHSQYDKSVESFNYSVENLGTEPLTFTAAYALEVRREGEWQSLPLAEGVGWNEESYTAAPGEVWENSFSFLPYDYQLTDGQYRLIKEIGGKLYRAEFTVGSGEGATDQPYGYPLLEDLPQDVEEIDCALRIDASGTVVGGDERRVTEFLGHVSQGTADMLRMVSSDAAGQPVVYDLLFENDSFLLRRDATRSTGEEITQRRYSFLTTDGEWVYLSDCAAPDSERMKGRSIAAGRYALLHRDWFGDWEAVSSAVEEMTGARLAATGTLARFWSEDGTYWVDLTGEGMDYTVSSRGYGMSRTLTECAAADDAELEIAAVRWETPTRLRLLCRTREAQETEEEMCWYAIFDVEREQVVLHGRTMWDVKNDAEHHF